MRCNFLHIKTVEKCLVSRMESSEQVLNNGILLKENLEFDKIDIIGMASIEVTDKIDNKQKVFTTKLVFKTVSRPELDYDHFCYRLTTVMGKRYIMGTKERPYTVFTTTENYPGSASDKAGCTCTVTYTNLFPLLTVLD